MLRWIWRVWALVVLCVVVSAVGGSYEYIAERRDLAAGPPPGRLIDIGGHRLHLLVRRSGGTGRDLRLLSWRNSARLVSRLA
jgi:hypothetical protein